MARSLKKNNANRYFKPALLVAVLLVGIGMIAFVGLPLITKAATGKDPRITGTIILSDEIKQSALGEVKAGSDLNGISARPFNNVISYSSGRSLYVFALPGGQLHCSVVITACAGSAFYSATLPNLNPATTAAGARTIAGDPGAPTGPTTPAFEAISSTGSGTPSIELGYRKESAPTMTTIFKADALPGDFDFYTNDFGTAMTFAGSDDASIDQTCTIAAKDKIDMSLVHDGIVGLSVRSPFILKPRLCVDSNKDGKDDIALSHGKLVPCLGSGLIGFNVISGISVVNSVANGAPYGGVFVQNVADLLRPTTGLVDDPNGVPEFLPLSYVAVAYSCDNVP